MEIKHLLKLFNRRSYTSQFEINIDSIGIGAIVIVLSLLRYSIKMSTCRIFEFFEEPHDRQLKSRFECSMFRFIVYFFISIFGIAYLFFGERWFIISNEIVLQWNDNIVPWYVRFHYMFEISLYITSTITIFTEPVFKDFYQMLLHHIITLFLIIGSFNINMLRYGIVIMALHDITDPILEFGKMAIYLNRKNIADLLFPVFVVMFFLFRIAYFPVRIIIPMIYYFYKYDVNCPHMCYFCLIALIVLYVINVVWFYMILKLAARIILTKKEIEDIRDSGVNIK